MSYWSDRQEKLNKALEKDEEKLKKRLNRIYDAEARRLERQIAAYYEMYGEDNVIDYRKLLEELPPEDKRLLIEDIDEFVKRYPDYADLVPVRESIYKLDRLEGLQQSVKMQQLRIGAQEQEMIKDHLVRTAYRGANASAEAMGFGSAFYSMNENIMKKFVDVPWADGESFSEKIWANKEKLTNYLNKDIAQGMARGDSYANLTKQIMERMGKVSRNDAYRLIYTEGTYVMAESSITPFEEDFEYFKVCTVGDNKVCSICKGLEDAEPVPISKRVPGENFPPLHPWCRCTFTIEVEDWDAWMDDYVAKHGQSAIDEAEQIAGNVGPEEEMTGHSMRRNEETEWEGVPQKHTKEEMDELETFAADKGIELDESFTSFDGDISLVKDFIQTMNDNISGKSFMRKDKIKLSLSYSMKDDTYAETQGANIIINGFAYRDRELLKNDYKKREKTRFFTEGSSYLDIATHECGHVIVYMNQLKNRDVVEKIFGKDAVKTKKIIKERLSVYALKDNNELIAEAYVKYKNGSKDEYVLRILRYCGIIN